MNKTVEAEIVETPTAEKAPVPIQQGSSLSPMVQAVMNGTMQADTLQQLLTIQKEYEANEAFKAYNIAMAQFRQDAPALKRDKVVSFPGSNGKTGTSFSHTTLGYTVAEVNPILGKNGLNYGWSIDDLTDPLKITVTCKLTHRNGHSESVTMWGSLDSTGSKNNLQAKKSTVSYLERTTLFAILGLASADDDDDGVASGGVKVITPGQATKLANKIKASGIDAKDYTAWLGSIGASKITEIPAAQLKAATAEVDRRMVKA